MLNIEKLVLERSGSASVVAVCVGEEECVGVLAGRRLACRTAEPQNRRTELGGG
jgi:hypothetical protein